MMTAALALALLGQPMAVPKELDLIPTDDIWVYPHASDPSQDAYLRVWGANGKSVAAPGESLEEFSYSFLKWNLKDLPSGAKVKSAVLILTHVANPEFTDSDVKARPIEVRGVASTFAEKGWQYAHADKLPPVSGEAGIIGRGGPLGKIADKNTTFEIPLVMTASATGGGFADYLAKAAASGSKELALALASKADPANGRGSVYKLFSKDGPKELRPVLRLVLEEGG